MICEDSVKRYCCEDPSLIEGYSEAIADQTQTWPCHHRLEVQGEFTNSIELLKKRGMYWHRPASELIFLTPSQHAKIHREQRVKAGRLGAKNQLRGGRVWWNDGTRNKHAKECPGDGWVRGMLKFGELPRRRPI